MKVRNLKIVAFNSLLIAISIGCGDILAKKTEDNRHAHPNTKTTETCLSDCPIGPTGNGEVKPTDNGEVKPTDKGEVKPTTVVTFDQIAVDKLIAEIQPVKSDTASSLQIINGIVTDLGVKNLKTSDVEPFIDTLTGKIRSYDDLLASYKTKLEAIEASGAKGPESYSAEKILPLRTDFDNHVKKLAALKTGLDNTKKVYDLLRAEDDVSGKASAATDDLDNAKTKAELESIVKKVISIYDEFLKGHEDTSFIDGSFFHDEIKQSAKELFDQFRTSRDQLTEMIDK